MIANLSEVVSKGLGERGRAVPGETLLCSLSSGGAGKARTHPQVLCLLQMSPSCRLVQVLLHYFVGANHLWLLVEGLYLHALLEPTVLPERRLWPRYLVVGWGE
jgi:hypothetical protein